MALVTYVTRAGGFWLMGLVTPSPRVQAWLRQIPGAVLVAIIAPTVLASSVAETLAAQRSDSNVSRSCSRMVATIAIEVKAHVFIQSSNCINTTRTELPTHFVRSAGQLR
jgi:uncharacterized membrane protein